VFDAIVLAGGGAARLGGVDKPGLQVAGASLLERVLAAVGPAGRIVVVGPTRALSPVGPPVVWCREDPPGGGPVAALAAALGHVDAELVLTLASDLPSIGPAVPQLLAALTAGPSDCAALVDAGGRVNYLAAAWRRAALQRALAALGDPTGASMRALVSAVSVTQVPDPQGWGLDCDTWADVDDARRRLNREGTVR
jgi:molybdopterin-guanine dinucleotide biosynthesis protein A